MFRRAAAPGARGTHATEGVPSAAPPQGAVGPELYEQALARESWWITVMQPATPNRLNGQPCGLFTGDIGTPQRFVTKPTTTELVGSVPVTNVPSTGTLPGRVPQGVWDGEPGAAAPTVG